MIAPDGKGKVKTVRHPPFVLGVKPQTIYGKRLNQGGGKVFVQKIPGRATIIEIRKAEQGQLAVRQIAVVVVTDKAPIVIYPKFRIVVSLDPGKVINKLVLGDVPSLGDYVVITSKVREGPVLKNHSRRESLQCF